MTGPPPPGDDLLRLIERSRRIGSRDDLVVHGGGNTSTKSERTDHRGRLRPVLLIKASGADLATLTPRGVCALFLDDLVALRARRAMDDAEMTDMLARCMVDPGSPRPSIETLLHAFIPHRDVDHVHADAICALTKAPDPRAAVRDALGPNVAFVEWIRPGFALARIVADVADAEAIVLAHHGLVTWSDSGDGSAERARAVVERAERYLAARRRPIRSDRPHAGGADGPDLDLVVRLRGRLSRRRRRILHLAAEGRSVSDRSDVQAIADAGPATADHLMYVRPWSVVIRSSADVDPAVTAAERRYTGYFERHRDRVPGATMHDPAPTVALIPGIGTVTVGGDAREARVIADVAAHTHAVAAAAIDALGAVRGLSEEDLFDVDHWPLELAKRAGRTDAAELGGRVHIVTGAGGAIGRATALALAGLGAHLVLTDIDEVALGATAEEVAGAGPVPRTVAGDVADEELADRLTREAVLAFGGLDGLVSNAGIAVTGELARLERADWDRSMAVNATSHFLLVRAALRVLEAQGIGGSIVFIASKNAFSPGAGFGPYSAAKAAQLQIARMTALEGGRIGVRANAINPDAVFEGSKLWSDELRASRAAAHHVPVERLEAFYASRNLLRVEVRPRDVAEAVVFLLSDRSSRTTGCVITVDGGVEGAFPR